MSLLGQRFVGTDEDAVRASRELSARFRFLVTPWPVQQVGEGVVFLGVGIWAAIRLGSSDLLGGLAILLAALVLVTIIAAPGVYTLQHRDQADRYFGARRAIAERQASAHPVWASMGYVLAGAVAGGLAGHGHQTTTIREVGAAIGAVVGLFLAAARIRQGRRHAHGGLAAHPQD